MRFSMKVELDDELMEQDDQVLELIRLLQITVHMLAARNLPDGPTGLDLFESDDDDAAQVGNVEWMVE